MNVILVEDELSARQNMLAIFEELSTEINVLTCLEGVDEAVKWIESNPKPDLCFFDIQLADGVSFEIFEKTEVSFPVVFTTAFDEYAIKAFKVNSIDYILKPIKKSDIEFAINKYQISQKQTITDKKLLDILNTITNKAVSEKKTILIKKYDGFVPVPVSDFAFFFIENGIVYGLTYKEEKHIIDETMDFLENKLNHTDFFRANRQSIASRKSIIEVNNCFNGRLLLKTKPKIKEQILISKARVNIFRQWLEM
jgi:two-component system LytT family response regulator